MLKFAHRVSFLTALLLVNPVVASTHDTTLSNVHSLFEENVGQADERWHFIKSSPNYRAAIGNTQVLFSLSQPTTAKTPGQNPRDEFAIEKLAQSESARNSSASSTQEPANALVTLVFVDASGSAKASGENKLATKTHRLNGASKSDWVSDISNFGTVRVSEVYTGIDVVYRNNGGNLQFDFVVAPGADAANIKLTFEGADATSINDNGSLSIDVAGSLLTQQQPVIYQEHKGQRQRIAGTYQQLDDNLIGFIVAEHNQHEPLIIDPTISYSTYIGGSGTDEVRNVRKLDDGSLLVAGQMSVQDFSPLSASGSSTNDSDAFVAKINPDGASLAFITYIGGDSAEGVFVLEEDGNGEIVVAGLTSSTNFPLLAAFDSTFSGGLPRGEFVNGEEGFVTKLSPDGASFIFSSYMGGNNADPGNVLFIGYEFLRNVEIRESDNAIVLVGETAAADFPVTHALNNRTCMETDINEVGSRFTSDVWVAIVGSTGELLASTCLGGSERDGGRDVTIIPDTGEIAIVGVTRSLDFPVSTGVYQPALNTTLDPFYYDAFVSVLSPDLTTLTRSTYIGGSNSEFNETISVNSKGKLVVGGLTLSLDFPVTANAAQSQNGQVMALPAFYSADFESQDVYFFLMDSALTTVEASTYYGGNFNEQVFVAELDDLDRIYFAGNTQAEDLPLVNPLQTAQGKRIGPDSQLVAANGATGYDAIELSHFISLPDGTGETLTYNFIARGGVNGATNLVQRYTDFYSEVNLALDLGPAVADTRAIVGSRGVFTTVDATRTGIITANCGDVSRVYEINNDRTVSLAGTFGDPQFCALGMALVQVNTDSLEDVVVHDGSILRYYINQGDGTFIEDTSYPTSFGTDISVLEKTSSNGIYVGSYGGADKSVSFQSSAAFEQVVGNGNKKTTGVVSVFRPGAQLVVTYDDHPMEAITSSGSTTTLDVATTIGRLDTNRVLAAGQARAGDFNDIGFYLYTLERDFNGDTLLSCYCDLQDDGSPRISDSETINLGPVDYSSLVVGDVLLTLTTNGAQVDARTYSDNDGYVAVLSSKLDRIEFSSYFSGAAYDLVTWGLDVEERGVFTIAGRFSDDDLPGLVEANSIDSERNGKSDGYVSTIDLRDVLDVDSDQVIDASDNCLLIANTNQIDIDGDGFGNACDGDFNQDQITNFLDFSIFSAQFLSTGPSVTDMNGDGVTNFIDLALFSAVFLQPPGPSGVD